MTTLNRFQLPVADTFVTAEAMIPSSPKCVLTLAHGAGAGMDHVFMVSLAKQLASVQIATVRFNFMYMEQNKKRPDVPARAHAVVEAVMKESAKIFDNLPLFLSGKSFGGRMSSQYVAKNQCSQVSGIIFYGFPLHPAGKPSVERAEHLKEIKMPMLFLQGTRDELATLSLLEPVCFNLNHATLVKIEGADHAFKIPRQNAIPILAEATDNWVEATVREGRR